MTCSDLDEMFRELIARFGREEVRRRLALLIENADSHSNDTLAKRPPRTRTNSRSKTKNAIEYVDTMDLPKRRKEKLRKLAMRFESKLFLPAVGDIRNLFYMHGVDTSSVKSRHASVARVFFFLSTLPENRLDAIIDDHSFSGPARLEPLASAIKERGRSRRSTEGERESFADDNADSHNDSSRNDK